MCADLDASPSFQAALDLVFSGRREPNGYTERALTQWRQKAKATDDGDESATREAVLSDEAPSPAS
jgi:malate synthase